MESIDKITDLWKNNNSKIVLLLLLAIFSFYSIFLAINLRSGIIPDETYRFEVSTYYAETWGIPDNVPIAYTSGDNLHRNPYLGYWLFGRVIRLTQLMKPDANERQILVSLRIANWLFSLGTILFTYGLSKQVINNKWWQLLPIFLLTNTLMFVFLSGGVNYDNPTNMACAAGIYFLVRIINGKNFISNSLGWMISISLGSLMKYSVLPLALVMTIVWVIVLIKRRKEINAHSLKDRKNILLIVIFTILIGLNLSLYGVNLIRFNSLIPSCQDTFPTDVCKSSFFGRRYEEMALPKKLTLIEAFKQGYPDPIRFTFDIWIREMLKRIFGIMGEVNYFPIVVSYFHVALYWLIFLGGRYIKKPSLKILSMIGIFLFYALTLLYMNYNSELVYGFNKFVALQGRYIFPVISIAFVLSTYILTKVSNKFIRFTTLGAMILLFLYGGPIRFIWYYNSVFRDWFI